MKTFSIKDDNKPMQFFTNCTGCILVPKKMDQVMIVTANGAQVPVGIQLPHALSVLLYEKIIEASEVNGRINLPNLTTMDDDEIRVTIEEMCVEDRQQ